MMMMLSPVLHDDHGHRQQRQWRYFLQRSAHYFAFFLCLLSFHYDEQRRRIQYEQSFASFSSFCRYSCWQCSRLQLFVSCSCCGCHCLGPKPAVAFFDKSCVVVARILLRLQRHHLFITRRCTYHHAYDVVSATFNMEI
jgi:hypothetical protein